MAICFIVGHGKSRSGGYDSGAVNGNYHEFKIAREISKYAADYYNVNYSETADLMNYNGDLYLTERIKLANSKKYDFIAEIHLNAGKGTGAEVFYSVGSSTGKATAANVSKAISKALGITNRGAKTKTGANGDYFGIIRQTKAEAILVETAFIDTVKDLDKIKTPAGQKACGIAIAQAIAVSRGIKTLTAAPVIEPTKKVYYFNKCNDKYTSIVDALKSLGFNSSFSYRKQIAAVNGIKAYIGTAKQNTTLLTLLKQGKLIKP
jgi:hypothetical protein